MEWLCRAVFDFLESGEEEPFYLYFAPTLLHSPSPLASLKEDPRKIGEGLLEEPINDVLPSRESVIERTLAAGLPEEAAGATWLDPEAPWLDNYFNSDQLYHLSEDPHESVNLAGDPAYAEKLREMKDLLRKHLEAVPGNFAELLD
jgi:hypothetical protein